MILLFIHADSISFEVTKPTRFGEELEAAPQTGQMKDALVVFAAVEDSDENSKDGVARRSIEETVRVCNQLGTRNVVVYPFAHLTSNLAKPQTALWALRRMEELLKEKGYQTLRAPFGWYKRLELKTKGHPLSELSRRVTA